MTERQWVDDAVCFGADDIDELDYYFFEDHVDNYATARAMCADCPVAQQCLDSAMKEEERAAKSRYGIRGGLSGNQRFKLHRELTKGKAPGEPDEMGRVRKLRAAGRDMTTIGRAVGVSGMTVSRWLARYGEEAA